MRQVTMGPDQAAAFFLFSLVAAVTPGPSNLVLAATGASAGVWRGLPCLLGVCAGMGAMMLGVALGRAGLLLVHHELVLAIKIAGAAFLLWIAWRIAAAGRGDERISAGPLGFVGAAAMQWVNPKAWMVSAGAAATYLEAGAGSPLGESARFALVFVAAALPSGFLWLASGAAVQRLLRSERGWRVFNIAMGVALAASVVMIL